jgi:hypothetical protein
MHVNDISRQQFSKIASRGFQGRMALTRQGLVLGAGTLLAKLDDNALPIEAEQQRIWMLLSVAYGEEISVVFGFGLLLFFLALLISNSCDDAAGKTARNSRGDIVKERLTICTGIGTVINHSVVLLPLKPSLV